MIVHQSVEDGLVFLITRLNQTCHVVFVLREYVEEHFNRESLVLVLVVQLAISEKSSKMFKPTFPSLDHINRRCNILKPLDCKFRELRKFKQSRRKRPKQISFQMQNFQVKKFTNDIAWNFLNIIIRKFQHSQTQRKGREILDPIIAQQGNFKKLQRCQIWNIPYIILRQNDFFQLIVIKKIHWKLGKSLTDMLGYDCLGRLAQWKVVFVNLLLLKDVDSLHL